MRTIMMTIRARHLRNMRKGKKGYELRKTRPSVAAPFRVMLCESGSGGKVKASFTCNTCLEVTDMAPERIAKLACITREEARGYKDKGKGQLFAYIVDDFRDLEAECGGAHIIDFGLKRPPQSWCYIEEGRNHE